MLRFRRKAPGVVDGEVIETPLELAREPERWQQLFGPALPLEAATIARYARREMSPGVALFSAGGGASSLVVGFSGGWLRLMLPVAAILQNMDETSHDLLLLTDSTRSHYRNGIGDFAHSFPALCDGIDRLRRSRDYRHLILFGTSMGALAALRAATLLESDRAIGIGPRFAWDISRIRRAKRRADAFDPLCACRNVEVSAYAVHSASMEEDMLHAQRLSRLMPQCRILDVHVPDHNILHPLLRKGSLGAFQRELFEPSRPIDTAAIAALFDTF